MPFIQVNTVLRAPVCHQSIQHSVSVQISQFDTPGGLYFRPKSACQREAAQTIVLVDHVRCRVVCDHNIAVTVTIQIPCRNCIACAELHTKRVTYRKTPFPIVQEYLIHLWPMTSVGYENVKITVAVYIHKCQRRRSIQLQAKKYLRSFGESTALRANTLSTEQY